MNVYQMWFEIQEQGGGELWLVRNSWSTIVARVQEVETPTGPAPYYGNPKVHVAIHYSNGKFKEFQELSCPGTFAYRRIQAPAS